MIKKNQLDFCNNDESIKKDSSTYFYKVRINPFRVESVIINSQNFPLYQLNDYVVIQSKKENHLGQIICIKKIHPVNSSCHIQIVRIANEIDFEHKKSLQNKEQDVKDFFDNLLKKFKITAKVVLVDFDLTNYKTYCYIVSERKIDYLLLHETAVDTLKTRVAIKQIGVRDYARYLGGIGICGRPLCCQSFLQNIQSISLTMVRQQNIFVEPEKISGVCSKLRCCLLFETNKND